MATTWRLRRAFIRRESSWQVLKSWLASSSALRALVDDVNHPSMADAEEIASLRRPEDDDFASPASDTQGPSGGRPGPVGGRGADAVPAVRPVGGVVLPSKGRPKAGRRTCASALWIATAPTWTPRSADGRSILLLLAGGYTWAVIAEVANTRARPARPSRGQSPRA